MKHLIALALVTLLACGSYAAEKNTSLELAYPLLGTIVVAQIGLVLEKTDILKKHGFDAHVTALGTGKELKTAMMSNKADVILTSESNFVVLRGNKFEGYAFSTFGSAGRLALVVKNDGKFKKPEDLKGKKIGAILGTTVHKEALEWKNKIDKKGIELINLGSVAAILSAIEAGTIEAGMVWDPFLENSLVSKKFLMLGFSEFDLINIVSKTYADKDQKIISRLNDSLRDAFFYFVTHKKEVNSWYAEQVKIDADTLDRASSINKNYNVKKVTELKMIINEDLKKKMEEISNFFFSEKVIPEKPNLMDFIK